jgi:hypothetical protein
MGQVVALFLRSGRAEGYVVGEGSPRSASAARPRTPPLLTRGLTWVVGAQGGVAHPPEQERRCRLVSALPPSRLVNPLQSSPQSTHQPIIHVEVHSVDPPRFPLPLFLQYSIISQINSFLAPFFGARFQLTKVCWGGFGTGVPPIRPL